MKFHDVLIDDNLKIFGCFASPDPQGHTNPSDKVRWFTPNCSCRWPGDNRRHMLMEPVRGET